MVTDVLLLLCSFFFFLSASSFKQDLPNSINSIHILPKSKNKLLTAIVRIRLQMCTGKEVSPFCTLLHLIIFKIRYMVDIVIYKF